MGRPKGSKNKPKIPPTTSPVIVPQPAAAVAEVKKTPVKKEAVAKQPKEKNLSQFKTVGPVQQEENGPSYLAINMDNFIFTEHLLVRYANYLLSQMREDSVQTAKDASNAGESSAVFLTKRILKSLGFTRDRIDTLVEEIKNYHNTNKPEQLYIRLRKK